jgi:hypothetical protein
MFALDIVNAIGNVDQTINILIKLAATFAHQLILKRLIFLKLSLTLDAFMSRNDF